MLIGQRRVSRLAVCGVLALAAFIGYVAPASAGWEMPKAFGPDGAGGTEFFLEASSVAVDEGHELLYVFDRQAGAIYKFDLDGHPVAFGGASSNVSGNKLTGLSIEGANLGEGQIAVNPHSHVVYVTCEPKENRNKALRAFYPNGDPAIFTATGTNEITGFFQLRGVAVDEKGSIYTADSGIDGKGIQVYAETGTVILSSLSGAPVSFPANLAVDSSGVIYVLRNSLEVAKYTPSEYPVTPATTYTSAPKLVDPHYSQGLAVDRQTDDLYVAEVEPAAQIAIYDEGGAFSESFGGPGESGELKAPQGLAAITTEEETRVYVADSPAGGTSQVKIFVEAIEELAPAIESTSVSDVTGDSATLRAKINPFNQPTTYWFEYGLEDCEVGPCEKVPAEGGQIVAGKKGVPVQFALTGLQAGTTYHFRVVAENPTGPAEPSPDKTFTTQTSGLGAALSDSRAWEMVSPPKKLGGVVFVNDGTAIQASSTGDKLAYASMGSLFEDPTSNRVPEPASLIAAREPNGAWSSRELTPPHEETSLFVHGQTEFKLFTPDLLHSVMEPSDNTPLSSEATERTPYLWDDGAPPVFTPLLTSANVPPGTEINPGPSEGNRVRIAAVSPDLSVIAIQSKPPLVVGAAEEGIYAWSDGELEAISELPASEGGGVVKGIAGTGEGSARHAISEDGSRVFWSSYNGEGNFAGLYLLDRTAGESTRLDVKETGGSGPGEVRPAFSGASADGSVVYFTDSQQLTADASPDGRDLYRCEVGDVGGGALGCTDLTDVSAPLAGLGENAEVIDQLPAISDDGARLFFVARGVLDEEPNEAGEVAEAGEPNLYYWEEGGSPRLVGVLSKEDRLVWGQKLAGGQTINTGVTISAAISPNGRYFTFTSENSLTGYENTNAEGKPTTEAFLYDTEAEEGERLACVSCNPSGAIAIGEQLTDKARNFPPDPGGLWAGRWVAATLPQATHIEFSGPSLYRPRAVLDNGRVFFNSVDPLVAADSNGEWDVYEYEPVGVGSCTANTDTATATRSGAGCVGLLSSGSAEGDAGFLDASQSGDDVFFMTPTSLSVLDRDEEMDVYDARVNGIPAVLHPVQECAGEACQPSVGAPNDPTPASESFKGAQTPLHCRKGQHKARKQGRTVCVHKKKPKHKKHHKKQTHKSGRASR
jgi:sugar lactone lactonase YvrE